MATTPEQRLKIIGNLNSDCLAKLREVGYKEPMARVEITNNGINIHRIKTATDEVETQEFGSAVEIYASEYKSPDYTKPNEISIASVGSLDPTENTGGVFRIKTAGFMLSNWEQVCKIVDKYVAEYRDLCEAFFRQQINTEK